MDSEVGCCCLSCWNVTKVSIYWSKCTDRPRQTNVTGSGKSGLKSPMIKQQKLAEMPFRWKIFNFFLAYIIK